jgi:hypothetical protein
MRRFCNMTSHGLKLCVPVFSALLMCSLFHCAALPTRQLHCICTGLDSIMVRLRTSYVRNKHMKGQLHLTTIFTPLCFFFFFFSATATPLYPPPPFPHHSENTMQLTWWNWLGLLFVLSLCYCKNKAYVRSMFLAFHILTATSKYFVVPAILLFLGNRGANSRCQYCVCFAAYGWMLEL